MVYHYPLVSMDVEYSTIFTFADLTAISDCVWLSILLAVSLAVNYKWRCSTNYQWDATQNNILQVVLEPVAFSDSELANAFCSGVEVL
jgi:hypothetical protein